MYNTSLCFLMGEGLGQSHRLARKWMKKAADHGHGKAQFEHGLGLFSVCITYSILQNARYSTNFWQYRLVFHILMIHTSVHLIEIDNMICGISNTN